MIQGKEEIALLMLSATNNAMCKERCKLCVLIIHMVVPYG
ncbi:hypothetical protein D019_0530 [Vibrio parahaemolyticus VP2007-095]|nr:hypothetical protein D019_0530 [Vibrio parahaemolyticus VP2007-095]